MATWVIDSLDQERLQTALEDAEAILLKTSLGLEHSADIHNLQFMADAFDLAVRDSLWGADESDDSRIEIRRLAATAFRLLRACPRPQDVLEQGLHLLRMACHGVLGDMGPDAARLLKAEPWSPLPTQSQDWGERTLAALVDVWLRLIRKDGWDDLRNVQGMIVSLRDAQRSYERDYMDKHQRSRSVGWELVALYHFSKAADDLAVFITQGEVNGDFMIKPLLEAQFDRAIRACERGGVPELEAMIRLAVACATQIASNSIWAVTRAVNSRVTGFVKELVSRQRGSIFEVLPPQRRALHEEGLLGSGRRSVIVSLPTSSGKTLIAQFRILQALNQFDAQQGWVAYLAPTRALVNQITRRLRREFQALGVPVEKVSPALEIDSIESGLLTDGDPESQFRVLVTTPEKLDLMIRGGWEERIGRPLTLIVVDEAHNLGEKQRGLRLELLLATINRECQNAQFLLLTPFVKNAREIARWLDDTNFQAISLALDWQPNDRAIGIVRPVKGALIKGRSFGYTRELQTRHTSRNTINVDGPLPLPTENALGLTWSKISGKPNAVAAATAQALKSRGGIIILAARPDYCWSLAELLATEANLIPTVGEEIRLVQDFLRAEYHEDFALIRLLQHGIGVHHRGLSDEAQQLVEWLFEEHKLQILVATTTIAQGMKFPVAGVIMASYQYFGSGYAEDMPAEDFWNVAGRAGRLDQGSLGIIALAADTDEKAEKLRKFIDMQVGELNSALIDMVQEAIANWGALRLNELLFRDERWSSFLQYLAHTYRQMEGGERFASEVEQVLRGTLGFAHLRSHNRRAAEQLLDAVREYGTRLEGKPLKLVDETGFSLEGVMRAMGALRENDLTAEVWRDERLFARQSDSLQRMMGVLLAVPELRPQLAGVLEGAIGDGDTLSAFVADWVNGSTLFQLATRYFRKDEGAFDEEGADIQKEQARVTKELQDCCRALYGRVAQTVSWGLSALQTITLAGRAEEFSPEELARFRNLPAWVYYGVNSDEALSLRMVGVPRDVAIALSKAVDVPAADLPATRRMLREGGSEAWLTALGERGMLYHRVWQQIEGF